MFYPRDEVSSKIMLNFPCFECKQSFDFSPAVIHADDDQPFCRNAIKLAISKSFCIPVYFPKNFHGGYSRAI